MRQSKIQLEILQAEDDTVKYPLDYAEDRSDKDYYERKSLSARVRVLKNDLIEQYGDFYNKKVWVFLCNYKEVKEKNIKTGARVSKINYDNEEYYVQLVIVDMSPFGHIDS